jgi:hypothetical protein
MGIDRIQSLKRSAFARGYGAIRKLKSETEAKGVQGKF